MAGLTITYDGYDLSKVMRFTDVIRPIGNERSVTTNDAPLIGFNVQDVKIGAKIIKVDFILKGQNLQELKHELAGIFNKNEPKKLIFSDEPDKYYQALVVNDINQETVKSWFQKGTIEFLVPDGVAHSSTYRQFENPTDTAGKLVFDLVNNGNVDAYPIITIKNNVENGYVGLVNTSGAIELGNREEVDRVAVKQSEMLLDYRNNGILNGFSDSSKNVAINNDGSENLIGTLGTISVWGRQHVHLQKRGGTTGNNAGSMTWIIPADSTGAIGSLNDYIWWRQIFLASESNQYGFIKISVSDDQGRFLYGLETFKRSHGMGCEYNLLASNGQGGYNVIKHWFFRGSDENMDNPFNSSRGFSDIIRNNDRLDVYWWGSRKVFTIPELKGRKSAKIHVTIGSVGDRPLVSNIYLDGIMYRKDFVVTSRNIPNRYPRGSVIVVDSEDDTVFVDGIDKFGDRVQGSGWLKIPPGNSQLEVYSSSWVRTKPTVTVKFEERYL